MPAFIPCPSSRTLSSRKRLWQLGALVCLAGATTTAPTRVARADVEACVTAHASGQRELRAGHYRLAKQLFLTCAVETCPQELIKECVGYLDQVRERVPTLVFSATDSENKDLSDVQVFAGEQRLVDRLDGRAVEVDPGKYIFRFVLPGGEVLTTEVLVRESDKGRDIRVSMPARKVPAASSGPLSHSPPLSPKLDYLPAYIGTGITALGLIGFITLAVAGKVQENRFATCAPNCAKEDYDSTRSLYLGADITLAVTGVAALVTTYLYVRPPTSLGPVRPQVGFHGGGSAMSMLVEGTF